jgi:hypothetical protein
VTRRRLEEIARRKRILTAQAAQDRAEVAAAYQKLHLSLDLKRNLLGVGRTLKAHPMLTAGASTVLASGLAGHLVKGAAQAVAITRVAMPLWSWWKQRRKP